MTYQERDPQEEGIAIVPATNVHRGTGTMLREVNIASNDHSRQNEDECVCNEFQLLPVNAFHGVQSEERVVTTYKLRAILLSHAKVHQEERHLMMRIG